MIQKITAGELKEGSIALLPTRPSLPSLYSGRSLGAKELREAFDKLPHLLAERFNALIESLGLYQEGEALNCFAEALATGLSEGHSLADLFSDIQNGAFCEYMSADGERTLAEVLSDLSGRVDGKFEYVIQEVGAGDIVTSVEGANGDIIVRKKYSSTNFATKAEFDRLKNAVEQSQQQSGVPASIKLVEARLTNVEDLLCNNMFVYQPDTGYNRGCIVPKKTLPYATLDKLGTVTPFVQSENLFPQGYVKLTHAPADAAAYTGVLSEKNGTITLSGGSFDRSALDITLFDGTLEKGRYVLSKLGISGLSYYVAFKSGDEILSYSIYSNASADYAFLLPDEANGVTVSIRLTDSQISGSVTPTFKREVLTLSPVHTIRTTGKNFLPSTVMNITNWTERTDENGTLFWDFYLDPYVPQPGKYTFYLNYTTTPWKVRFLYLYRSLDGGNTWEPPEGKTDACILSGEGSKLPFTFEIKANESWRLTFYTSELSPPLKISNTQLEAGEYNTLYEKYKENVFYVPSRITSLDGFGLGYDEYLYNYIDFEANVLVKDVYVRDFETGDEQISSVKTDGFQSITFQYQEKTPLPEGDNDFTILPVEPGGAIFFDSDYNIPVNYAVTYQISK